HPPRKSSTTALERWESAMKTALSPWWNTHSHQFALPTLMPVSSEASAVPAISRALIRLVRAAKGLPAGRKNVDQRALADLQAKQVAQHMAQSRQRNPLNGAQINHKGAQVRPERRPRLQPCRRFGLEALGAAWADAAI